MTQEQFFSSALIYLAAAVISVPLAKKFGLSAVLGYLVAGMVIGPFGLRAIGQEGESVMHFAEFGVVMMLFLIGLELQPSMLWRMRGKILGLGGVQVIVTTAVITGIAMACGLVWQMALAIGMALSLSSTAIVMQSLQEKGLSKTSGGRSAFSVLLFQDIAVIPILAVYPMLATISPSSAGNDHGGEGSAFQQWIAHQPSWVLTLLVLAAVVLIILASRLLLRPVLRTVAATGVREVFVALALLIVIGIASIMMQLGVSAALGTFIAGVVLADSEYRHELESDIEPFKGLLLGVFFIAVGAAIDFALIKSMPLTVAAIVLGLIFIKAAIIFTIGGIAKLGSDQRVLFSLSLAQGSEFAFVLFGFALSEGILPAETTQLLIASVAISMALTPLIMMVEEKVLRPKLGTREVDDKQADEIDEQSPFILAGVGRFGNFVARMLRAQGYPLTVIDSDSEHVEFLRKLGIETFYGDASRLDLLESAGAAEAKTIMIAIDDEEKILHIIELCRKHFPQLKIMARALSRTHEYELIQLGVDFVIHQHSGSATAMAEAALKCLGQRANQAHRAACYFTKHDKIVTQQAAEIHRDQGQYISLIREKISELEGFNLQDANSHKSAIEKAWASERLRKAAEKKQNIQAGESS